MVGSNPSNISNQKRKLNIGSPIILRDGSGCEASSYENLGIRTRSSLNAVWLRHPAGGGKRPCWIERIPSSSLGPRSVDK